MKTLRHPAVILAWSLCCGLVLSQCSRDQPMTSRLASETDDAKAELQELLTLNEQISPYVERMDRARLALLPQATTRVLDAIAKNGLVHMATLTEYQVMIITYRSSRIFLGSIQTTVTEPMIHRMEAAVQEIAARHGVDVPTKITLSVFQQLKREGDRLLTMPIPDGLKAKVTDLAPDFGDVIARAQQDGDRRLTLEAGRELYHKIVALYPDLDALAGSAEVYDVGLSIRALAEFYAEFVQDQENL